jgi:methionyl aminopeptidase
MIILKSEDEIKMMRESGHITALVLRELEKSTVEGITTRELDRIAEDLIIKMKAKPAFKGYKSYPSSTTISINEEVVHGIPGKRKLKNGDIVSIDMGVFLKEYCSDAAISLIVGQNDDEKKKLLRVTKEALYKGIEKAVQGLRLGDLSSAIQEHVEANGYSVVRDLVGHGIGRAMHEEPQVPNYGTKGMGTLLRTGMVLAIEPMVNMGTHKIYIKEDNWTVVTQDSKCSAHFEHTVAITKNGPRILTLPSSATREEEYPFSQWN